MKPGPAFAFILALLAAVVPVTAQPATAQLVIHIRGVSPKGGMVRLGVYDRANYADDKKTVADADVPARAGETVVTLGNIPPGVYAIEVFQDINSDGRMNQSWIGLPLEPYGFSRDARPVLSKPGFEKVQITLAPGHNEQVINLQNAGS
jgi:uncharacterized protein (DUF2141 family)